MTIKRKLTFYTMIFGITLLFVLTFAIWSYAATYTGTVTMQTANCSVTANTIKFDVTVTNNGPSIVDFNSTVVRFTISSAIIPSGTVQGDIVFAYDTTDVSTSTVPNIWPPYSYPAFSFTNTGRLAGVSSGTGIYTLSNCANTAISVGGTITIGTFLIVETKQNWTPGIAVGLTWSTTSSVNAYVACAGSTYGFNNTDHQVTYATPCSLTTPPCNCAIPLNIKMFIQGYYLGSSLMQPVLFNQGIDPNPASVKVDTVTISLVDSILLANDPNDNYYDADTVATAKGILQTDGSLTVMFPSGVASKNYYLMVTHRNALQTWSAKTVTIISGGLYDFTTGAGMAYGSNQVDVYKEGIWSIYSGDINQDQGIDGSDFIVLYPDIRSGNGGYLSTDLNGDGGVDGSDFIVLYPNIKAGGGSSHP